ncbi:MAG: hypothetical protein K6D02_02500 [Lachnospiraceae bacterium]|nr:hypothetical protein [Lachnospiraceae bacterium]
MNSEKVSVYKKKNAFASCIAFCLVLVMAVLCSGSFTGVKASAASIPTKYDLRKKKLTTSIKDQGVTGSCWAFAALKALESSAIKNNVLTKSKANLSENHLVWFAYHKSEDKSDLVYNDGITATKVARGAANTSSAETEGVADEKISQASAINARAASAEDPEVQTALMRNSLVSRNASEVSAEDITPYLSGGSASLAVFTLARGSGAVFESLAPFKATTYSELVDTVAYMVKNGEALRYKQSVRLQNAICYTGAGNKVIKKALMKYGALDVSVYYKSSYVRYTSDSVYNYYQNAITKKYAETYANHCVTIVGWNDNYSKNKFKIKPKKNGAWLVANSYGTSSDKGYFWLSYYDQSITDIFSMRATKANLYSTVYQYDGMGYSDTSKAFSGAVEAANVYTNNTDTPKKIKAVSFYTIKKNQKFAVKCYKDLTSKNPNSGTLVSAATSSGTKKRTGYYTVKLKKAVTIEPGEKFAVSVVYKKDSKTSTLVPIEGSNFSMSGIKFTYGAAANQSFLKYKKWYDAYDLGYNNLCVKACATEG